MFWSLPLIGWLSLHHLVVFFSRALICSFIWAIYFFLSQCTWYIVRGGALGIQQGGVTHFSVFWHCMWGRGLRGNNAACSALSQLSITPPATNKQTGPFCWWCPGGRVCVHSRALWSLQWPLLWGWEFFPLSQHPKFLFGQRFWGFISLCWNPGLHGLSHSPVFLPVYLHTNVGPPGPPAAALTWIFSALVAHLHPSYLVWVNVSSLTPWLWDFHVV